MANRQSSYEAAGVSIDAGNRAVDLMREAVRSTYSDRVLAGIGSFGGVYDVSHLAQMAAPALVASTDGVGTKTKIAAALGRYDSIGHDIVNHSVNDILVQGAAPLFFLDYIASAKLDPQVIATIVTGISAACVQAGCALLGGETAEMPGVYQPDEFDLVGTIVGVVERDQMLPLPTVRPGDVVLGWPSSGAHTNGYSLIRRVFADTSLDREFDGVGRLGSALLAPHRSYLAVVRALRAQVSVKALAHLTGGGVLENLPRVLPAGAGARIETQRWPVTPLFDLIQSKGRIEPDEMFRVFNMGIGMLTLVAAEDVDRARRVDPSLHVLGEIVAGDRQVALE